MKIKTIIIIFACVLAAAFILGMTGMIVLGGNDTQPLRDDRLIGVLLTTEPLELGENGRVDGQLVARTDYNDDGEAIYSSEYIFESVDGVFCYVAEINDENGRYTTTGGEGVADSHVNFNNSDSGDKTVTYECTVGVTCTEEQESWICEYPVYQTADGEIYAVSGDSNVAYGSYPNGSEVVCLTLSEEYTSTLNGRSASESFSISVHVKAVSEAQDITVIRMDAGDRVIGEEIYLPAQLPEKFTFSADTEYIIVRQTTSVPDGQKTERSIYKRGDETVEIWRSRGDGFCVPVGAAVEWQ